jgi:hypothetical protein
MKKIILLLLGLSILSCESKKEYQYIEIINDESITGDIEEKEKEPKLFEAENDSIAYLEAYNYFCISKKVYDDSKSKGIKTYSTPLEYKIIDENGSDITTQEIVYDLKKGKSERDKVLGSMENVYKDVAIDKSESIIKLDSSKIKKLKPLFKHKIDEFSEDKTVWVIPKSSAQFRNMNGIYCYFATGNFRFVFQYHKDDWLFIKKCNFLIDGEPFEYIPQNLKRDNDETGITEWFDDQVNYNNRRLIESLANAKTAKVKLTGDNYVDVRVITKKQISSIKQTLEYYRALGNDI